MKYIRTMEDNCELLGDEKKNNYFCNHDYCFFLLGVIFYYDC